MFSVTTIINIKKVSLVFFIITGTLHLGSSIFIANEIFLKMSTILNKTMDIPFVLTGLLYGFSSARIALTKPEIDHKTLDIIFLSIIVIVLIALLAVNLFVPNLPL